jgi:hypothetical protein
MSIFESRPEKRIATDHATDEPTYLGTDADGAVHYWSILDRRVIVVDGDDVATCDLADLRRPLKHWREHTASERGWTDCQIASGQPLVGNA